MENILRKGEFSCFKLSFPHIVFHNYTVMNLGLLGYGPNPPPLKKMWAKKCLQWAVMHLVRYEQGRSICWPNCLNPFPNKPWFLRVCRTILSKTLAISLFPTVFSTNLDNFMPFSSNLKCVVCKLFQFRRV